mmetsp:Transcript_68477/g.155144  ORF Transcript_68477/g.155144 Transcript_68477/m.155144 type:complete len:691 (-) Transcript_68477:135-2207(-)
MLLVPDGCCSLSGKEDNEQDEAGVRQLKEGLRSEWGNMKSSLEGVLQTHLRKQEKLIQDYVDTRVQESLVDAMRHEVEEAEVAASSSVHLPIDGGMPDWAATVPDSAHGFKMRAALNRSPTEAMAKQIAHLQRPLWKDSQNSFRARSSLRRQKNSAKLDDARVHSVTSTTSTSTPSPWGPSLSGMTLRRSNSKSPGHNWLAEAGLDSLVENSRFVRFMDWCLSLEEPNREGPLYSFVYCKPFGALCTLVILLNAIFEIYSTDYELMHVKQKVMETRSFIWIVDSAFLSFYIFEIGLKLVLHRLFLFVNDNFRWNIFDLCLVVFTVYGQWIARMLGRAGDTDLAFMRSMRILKMAKVLRIVRMFRFITELRLMMNSVIGSLLSLFWSFVGLLFIFYIFGLVFVQGVLSYLRETEVELDPELGDKFGSVQAAMLSLYMAATGGDDWVSFFDCIKVTGPRNAVLFLVFMLFIQIAVMNIVTGIFVENAMKLAQPDREAQALQQRKKDMAEADDLRKLCMEIDSDGSGGISLDEFCEAYDQNTKLRDHFQVLGLDISDAQMFFEILCAIHNEDHVDIDSFVACCMRLRGFATSIELQNLQLQSMAIYRNQKKFNEYCRRMLDMLADQLQPSLKHQDLAKVLQTPVEAERPVLESSRKRALIRLALLCSKDEGKGGKEPCPGRALSQQRSGISEC